MSSSPPRLLRRLAGLLVRGPEAPYVLGDLEEAFERDLARGLPPRRARRRYLVNALGSGLTLTWSRLRHRGPTTSWLDVKLGLRMAGRQPGLTAVAVFALAIAIPASMIPFQLVRAFQVDLPFDQGDRIVGLGNRNGRSARMSEASLRDFEGWRAAATSFTALGAARLGSYNVISEDGRAAPVRGSEVTASTFGILRVAPLLGRPLLADDEVPGAPNVVVIGYELWESRLGGVPDVVGRTIRIGGVPHEIVGVMPEDFLFPWRDHLWLPLRARAVNYPPGGSPSLAVYGRLADGVRLEEASAEVESIGRRLTAEQPVARAGIRSAAVPFATLVIGTDFSDDRDFYVMKVVAMLLLSIACGNVGTLILARTASRAGELAVRTALGASRARIVSQLFVEALVLAVMAAGVGLVLANHLSHRFLANFESEMPFFLDFGVSRETVVWALLLAAASAVLAGVIPALKATGRGVQATLRRSAAGASGVRFGGLSSALIVAEVAVSVCFLALGGTLVRGALSDRSVGMGIRAEEYLSVDVRMPRVEPTTAEVQTFDAALRTRVATTQDELARRLASETGVLGVAFAGILPGHDHHDDWIEVEGEDAPPDPRGHFVRWTRVGLGFFAGLGQPILSGRDFDQADLTGTDPRARPAVIVNSSFVHDVLGDRSAIGRRFRYTPREGDQPGPWYEIVGVVGHLGMNEAAPDKDAGFYHPAAPGELNPVSVAIHLAGEPLAFVPRLRQIVAGVDPTAMVEDASLMTRVLSEVRLASQWGSLVLGLLASIAIVLSAAGLYALIAFTVSQRTREIGIRTALGAMPHDIVVAVARRAFVQLALGVALGAALSALGVSHVFASDFTLTASTWSRPALITAVGTLTLTVGLLACVPPTLRGLRIRPVEALKES